MGNEEAIKPEEEPVIEATEVAEDAPSEDGAEETPEVVEVPDNEIVLEGEEGSQPDKQSGIRKRINKLNAKVDVANSATSDAEQRLTVVEEQNKLLRMAADQRKEAEAPNTPPDPDDFNDGVKDPKYVQAFNAYNQPLIDAAVERKTSHLSQQQQSDSANSNLVKMQEKHYERADDLGIKDFDEVEGKAIGILGKEITNQLIANSPDSHLILYHLGKNPGKADHFSQLVKTDPLKAILQLGALGAKLSVKPKAKTEPTPDPDEELQGGNPSAGQANKFQRLVDKAREAAQNGGNMQAVMKLKKEAAAAGVTVT